MLQTKQTNKQKPEKQDEYNQENVVMPLLTCLSILINAQINETDCANSLNGIVFCKLQIVHAHFDFR